MLAGELATRFRALLQSEQQQVTPETVQFAIDFALLLGQVTVGQALGRSARQAFRATLAARTGIEGAPLDLLLDLALAPDSRAEPSDDDLRAFGARFGAAEEAALRASMADELDLEGFVQRYGPEEGLLLLDALFAVCATDGVIDREEIGRLSIAAQRLGIDSVLVGALYRKHDLRHASGDFRWQLDRDRYLIGSAPNADIQLPDSLVAPRHAELSRSNTGWMLRDLGSGRSTLLDGAAVAQAPITAGSAVRIGSYTLALDKGGRALTAFGNRSFSALSVRKLTRTIGKVTLLDDVSFTVFSGEVVAVVGPSGAGKTTLLNAIAGIAPADTGDVIFDGQNFHTLLANDRSLVGIVPQDDVIHPELTVRESLTYAGRLRLPPGTRSDQLKAEVDRVLADLDIERIASNRIGDALRRGVSGGQRKRVNLGQELLTRTTRVLFLDEPTSGLDPQTAQDIVGLIRHLADDGRIVFLVTHDVTPTVLSMVDHLMVLAPGGRLAWFGPPPEACAYFGVQSADQIFASLATRPAASWGPAFRDGPSGRKYVRSREHLLGLDGVSVQPQRSRVHRPGRLRQLRTLTSRYAMVKRRDAAGLGVIGAQAPVLVLLMWAVFPAPDPAQLFMLQLSALWFGASISVRELISERPIWRREARVGLSTLPYLASKALVLGFLVALQCLVLVLGNYFLLSMGDFGFSAPYLLAVTTLTGWVGMSLGLLISSRMSSSEAAVGALPLLLIPQITFGGLLVKVKEMGALATAFSWAMFVRYSFEASIKTGERLTDPAQGGNERVTRPVSATLYNLGFKASAAADDFGTPQGLLLGALVASLALLLLGATWYTRRSREGN